MHKSHRRNRLDAFENTACTGRTPQAKLFIVVAISFENNQMYPTKEFSIPSWPSFHTILSWAEHINSTFFCFYISKNRVDSSEGVNLRLILVRTPLVVHISNHICKLQLSVHSFYCVLLVLPIPFGIYQLPFKSHLQWTTVTRRIGSYIAVGHTGTMLYTNLHVELLFTKIDIIKYIFRSTQRRRGSRLFATSSR